MDKKDTKKLWVLNESDGGQQIAFHCQGCNGLHSYIVKMGEKTAKYRKDNGLNIVEWSFNGDMDKPTFKPSLLYFKSDTQPRCHLFLTDGKISYCSDSEHRLAGQTVDLVDIPD